MNTYTEESRHAMRSNSRVCQLGNPKQQEHQALQGMAMSGRVQIPLDWEG